MSKLNAADRKALPSSDFAIKSKASTPQGKANSGSFPINDKAHAQNALARSSGKPVATQVRAAVAKKYPSMGSPKKSAAKISANLKARNKTKSSVGF